jgi:hypothetical protein
MQVAESSPYSRSYRLDRLDRESSALDTVAALLAAQDELFQMIVQLEPPFILAIYKDGSIRRLGLEDVEMRDEDGDAREAGAA